MKYISTRGDKEEIRSAQAIIRGLAPDKGLYVPASMPDEGIDLKSLISATYQNIAYKTLSLFFDDFHEDDLHKSVLGAYDDKFDTELIAPLVKAGGAYFLELYHGRTAAFKDMALSILPYLMLYATRRENEDKKIVILTATSGDTGKAALEGFADVSGTEIFVFYPKDGVSEIQKRQMVTQRGANVHVYAVSGNFDDAQKAVKDIFNDDAFAAKLSGEGCRLSSANSINIGRLVPQLAYYLYAYAQMVETGGAELGAPVNIVVPTGNFGNILAAWYASKIGLPVNRLICASNENNVLSDFIRTGVYDSNRKFHLTSSPSMDILISSNLERLLWHLSGGDCEQIISYMRSLEVDGRYEVGAAVREDLGFFYGGYADMNSVDDIIARLWREENYLVDPHTAVAYSVYESYRKNSGDDTPALIAATASAYKFADSVASCLSLPTQPDGFAYIEEIHEATGVDVPERLKGLENKSVIHRDELSPAEMKSAIAEALK